jgi:hypothetical protein
MGRLVTNVSQLTGGTNGERAVLTAGGTSVKLRYNAAADCWVGRPTPTMTQHANVGMSVDGAELTWKYPAANTENPIPHTPPVRSQGFQIHKLPDGGALWAAGLRLQERLSVRMRAGALGGTTLNPEIALAWYPLDNGDDFLTPSSFNHGVRVTGERDSTRAHFYSSGWQNRVFSVEPGATESLYPEIYAYGPVMSFWNFTAHHRWITPNAAALAPRPNTRPPIDELVNWHRADDIAANNGDPVSMWTDYSGYGRNLAQTDSSKRPVLTKSALNGHAVVTFDGVNDVLRQTLGGSAVSQPFTIIMVLRQRASGGVQQVWIGPDGSGQPLFYRGNATNQVNVWLGGSDLIYTRGSNWPMNYLVWTVVCNGASTTIYENTTQVATGNAGAGGIVGLTLGNGGAETLPAAIDVAELIVANKAATTQERGDTVAMLMAKYGL